jgi:hypothetical protein
MISASQFCTRSGFSRASSHLTRRGFLEALATVSALALLAGHPPACADDIVEINGWILKRSDFA